jgi:predicted Zn-ribbon and HTH transcriptional regulator
MKHRSVSRGFELVTVGEASMLKAETRLVACQACSPSVSRSFGSVLIEVLGANDLMTEYVLCVPAECPNCGESIVENTLVRCEGEREADAVPTVKEYEPDWEETNVVLVDESALSEAQGFITGCEQCVPHAEMTFDYILDEVTRRDPALTEYVLCHPAKCPQCGHEVTEKTFVIAQ